MADEGDDLARLGGEADLVEHRTVRDVGEADTTEFDVSVQARACDRVGFVRPRGRGVEHAEVAFRTGHRERRFGELRADDRDRGEEQVCQEEERHQVAQARARAGEGGPAADADERGHEAVGIEFQQRKVEGGQAGGLHDIAGEAAHETREDAGVGVLAGEALRDADALHRLGQGRGHAGERLLLHTGGVQDLAAEEGMDQQQAGDDGQQDQEQPGVGEQHQRCGAGHLAERDEGDEEVVLDAVAHRFDVRDHPADQAAVAAGVEERERLRKQVRHQAVAEVPEHVLADLVRQPDAPVERDVGHDEEDREEGERPEGRGAVARLDRAFDDRADEPGEAGQGHRAEDAEAEQGVTLQAVGAGEREQAGDGRPAQRQPVRFLFVGPQAADRDLEGRLAHAGAPSDWTRIARR